MPANSIKSKISPARSVAALLALVAFPSGILLRAEEYPKAKISNGLVRAEISLPDPVRGSYRGTRFDWSGIVSSLHFSGHQYFGSWQDVRDPKIHDAVTGPAEEFLTGDDSALGYEETKPGATFPRIGIGAVRKPDGETVYRRFSTYDIVDQGKWTIERKKDSIEFVHELKSEDGYAYIYRKKLRLIRGKPQLEIDHSLKNTGRKTIDMVQYNHNFLAIDNQVVGPDVSVRFAFDPKPTRELRNGGKIRGRELTYSQELQKGQTVSSWLEGFGEDAKDYDFRIENRQAGAGVRVSSDRPMTKLNFWSIRTVACPEPYIHVLVEPGSESHWKLRYDFYTFTPSKPSK